MGLRVQGLQLRVQAMESQQGHETRHGNALVLQSIAVVRREVSKPLASVAARVVWMVVVLVVLVAVVAVVFLCSSWTAAAATDLEAASLHDAKPCNLPVRGLLSPGP